MIKRKTAAKTTAGISFEISDHWDVMGHIGRLAYDSIDKTLLFSTTGVGALSLGLYYSF